jgi:hypothetical protein
MNQIGSRILGSSVFYFDRVYAYVYILCKSSLVLIKARSLYTKTVKEDFYEEKAENKKFDLFVNAK